MYTRNLILLSLLLPYVGPTLGTFGRKLCLLDTMRYTNIYIPFIIASFLYMHCIFIANPLFPSFYSGFMFYKSGIISSQCGRSLDHAITAVGYGKDEKTGTYSN